MINLRNKLMLTTVVASMSIMGNMSYAAPGKSQGAGGWEPSADHMESVVIALKTDPTEEAGSEAACVALQIGMNLMMDDLNRDGEVDAIPADEVILFPTLDGVELVAEDNDFSTVECRTPGGPASLSGLLSDFVNMGGEIVVCPLCWAERYLGESPTYGKIGNPWDIHNLFLYSDKVIDF